MNTFNELNANILNVVKKYVSFKDQVAQEKFLTEIVTTFSKTNINSEKKSVNNYENKLKILYEYEKHYLELVKEYKEEIKFINTNQEDLRRERAEFFTQDLKLVSQSLSEAQVDKNVSSKWIENLVESYTNSLDASNDLIKINVVEKLNELKKECKNEISNMDEAASDNIDDTDEE
jgi:hypothetical protein